MCIINDALNRKTVNIIIYYRGNGMSGIKPIDNPMFKHDAY